MIDKGAGIYAPITLKDDYDDVKPEVDVAEETNSVEVEERRTKKDKKKTTTSTSSVSSAATSTPTQSDVDKSKEKSKSSEVVANGTVLITNATALEDRLLGDDPYSNDPRYNPDVIKK